MNIHEATQISDLMLFMSQYQKTCARGEAGITTPFSTWFISIFNSRAVDIILKHALFALHYLSLFIN